MGLLVIDCRRTEEGCPCLVFDQKWVLQKHCFSWLILGDNYFKICYLFHYRFPSQLESVSFCFMYFEALSFGPTTFRVLKSSGWVSFIVRYSSSLVIFFA